MTGRLRSVKSVASAVSEPYTMITDRIMSEAQHSPVGSQDAISTLILTIHEDMGGNFVQTVCPDAGGTVGAAVIEGQPFALRVLAEDPRSSADWSEQVGNADAFVLQVRFMDTLSVDRLKAICAHLPQNPPKPMGVFLLREEGEADFKMSCPACGQKLWVRDTDEGKRGRCPNCKKAFRLPSQAAHTRQELGLADTVAVTRVTRGNAASCRQALGSLKGSPAGGIPATDTPADSEILMKSTVRIDISNTPLSAES